MDFLTVLLAGVIDKFKTQSPQLFLIIQFAIGTMIYMVHNCVGIFDFCAADGYSAVKLFLEGTLAVIFGLNGSHTSKILKK